MTGKKPKTKGAEMTYAGTGVDYDAMDPFKRMAQLAGRETDMLASGHGYRVVEMSRGESVFLLEGPRHFLAHVEEGLGTKNLVAEAMYFETNSTYYYAWIAQDTVAMIVNDLVTLGALPLSVAMHLAVANSNWFKNERRCADLVAGWKGACILAGCVWGGGETPTLRDIVLPNTFVLAGSAIGLVKPKSRLLSPEKIRPDDAIIIVESNGIMANGLTLARDLANRLPNRYLTELPDRQTYGDALLAPTPIYVPVMRALLEAHVDLHYAVNITGHGWRKFMRAPQPLTYVIAKLPGQLPIFDFIQERGPVTDYEAYSTFNMGAGFALYLPQREVKKALGVIGRDASANWAFLAGHIETGKRRVVIEPLGLEYGEETLGVR